MHAIGLFIESLKNQIVDSNQRSTLDKLKQSSTELNQLLNNILGFSKLDINNNPVAKTQRDSTSSKTPEMLETYKLLVIDDNPAVLSAMQMMLDSMNCDVYPASDIPEALEIIKELDELPDLLVVDYQLANGVTGCTAIEKICKAANNELPAIIVTGNTNSELYQRARKHGHRVLSKPVNPKILLDTIASTIENHRHLVA